MSELLPGPRQPPPDKCALDIVEFYCRRRLSRCHDPHCPECRYVRSLTPEQFMSDNDAAFDGLNARLALIRYKAGLSLDPGAGGGG